MNLKYLIEKVTNREKMNVELTSNVQDQIYIYFHKLCYLRKKSNIEEEKNHKPKNPLKRGGKSEKKVAILVYNWRGKTIGAFVALF